MDAVLATVATCTDEWFNAIREEGLAQDDVYRKMTVLLEHRTWQAQRDAILASAPDEENPARLMAHVLNEAGITAFQTLLDHGVECSVNGNGPEPDFSDLGDCYETALLLAKELGNQYVEGIAGYGDQWFPHAWTYNPETGQHMCPSWSQDFQGYGVILDPVRAEEFCMAISKYGVLRSDTNTMLFKGLISTLSNDTT